MLAYIRYASGVCLLTPIVPFGLLERIEFLRFPLGDSFHVSSMKAVVFVIKACGRVHKNLTLGDAQLFPEAACVGVLTANAFGNDCHCVFFGYVHVSLLAVMR